MMAKEAVDERAWLNLHKEMCEMIDITTLGFLLCS